MKIAEYCRNDLNHHYRPLKKNCRNPLCYVCHWRYAALQAEQLVKRLLGVRQAYHIAGVDLWRYRHVLLSPPQDLYHNFASLKGLQKIQAQAIKYADMLGIPGGAMVLHQKRGKPYLIDLYKQGKIDLQDSWHWHIVATAPDDLKMRYEAFYEATGWVVKEWPIFQQDERQGMFELAKYECNHAALYQKAGSNRLSEAVRYFGIAAKNKVKVDKTIYKEPVVCRTCADSIVIGSADAEPETMIPRMHKIEERAYNVKQDDTRAIAQKYAILAGVPHRDKLITENDL